MGLAPEGKVKHLQSQTRALEMRLAHRTEMTENATADLRSVKEQLNEATHKYDEERQAAFDITRDMTRQYKGMQDELLNKINARDNAIHGLKDEIHAMKISHHDSLEEKDCKIQERETEISNLRRQLEEMGVECSKMFANLLSKMQIEVHSAGEDQVVPILKRMEEFELVTGSKL